MRKPYIPRGCDQQGRLNTGVRHDSPIKSGEVAGNNWLWWALAIVLAVMMFSAVSVWGVVA